MNTPALAWCRLALLWAVLNAILLGASTSAFTGTDQDRASAGIGTVSTLQLPPEARDTLRLIASGGTFRYARDGVVFGNRERLLPRKPRGYYKEYTVFTPGSNDRGARRIISGQSGELYYTDDHYRSFKRILQ